MTHSIIPFKTAAAANRTEDTCMILRKPNIIPFQKKIPLMERINTGLGFLCVFLNLGCIALSAVLLGYALLLQ